MTVCIPIEAVQLYVDDVEYSTFDTPCDAFRWLDENFPDWGDRDIWFLDVSGNEIEPADFL